ncbi:hypothetical protein DL89DRAFT_271197 [Linderina pennispora]|uniref:CCHC-type domain-containing protein n=1 Tax=Linderina pennispora TaxID=61395 RepID=A0A1Y1VWW2_9FUNG|nr:uncharacterized protein DL89DRAFT_271197 [Linderina pennispora]ORX65234.1 hypothetical protein DL89DRAFT_271197 [Linderina pennispora]
MSLTHWKRDMMDMFEGLCVTDERDQFKLASATISPELRDAWASYQDSRNTDIVDETMKLQDSFSNLYDFLYSREAASGDSVIALSKLQQLTLAEDAESTNEFNTRFDQLARQAGIKSDALLADQYVLCLPLTMRTSVMRNSNKFLISRKAATLRELQFAHRSAATHNTARSSITGSATDGEPMEGDNLKVHAAKTRSQRTMGYRGSSSMLFDRVKGWVTYDEFTACLKARKCIACGHEGHIFRQCDVARQKGATGNKNTAQVNQLNMETGNESDDSFSGSPLGKECWNLKI